MVLKAIAGTCTAWLVVKLLNLPLMNFFYACTYLNSRRANKQDNADLVSSAMCNEIVHDLTGIFEPVNSVLTRAQAADFCSPYFFVLVEG